MEVKVNGKRYSFEVHGTVGLLYKAETMLGGEKFDWKNNIHLITLFYAIFYQSNKHKGDIPDMDDFMCSQTTQSIREMDVYLAKRWKELEPAPTGKEDAAEGEG